MGFKNKHTNKNRYKNMNPSTQQFLAAINPNQPQGAPQGGPPQQQLHFAPPAQPQAPQGQFQQPPPPPWQGQPAAPQQGPVVPQGGFQPPPQQGFQAPPQQGFQAPPQQGFQQPAPMQQGFQPQPMPAPMPAPQQGFQSPPQQPQGFPGGQFGGNSAPQGFQPQPTAAPQQGFGQQQPMSGGAGMGGNAFFFQGCGDVEITNQQPKLKGGCTAIVRIMRIEPKNTNQAGQKIFVEFDIMQSNDPSLYPPGQRFSWGISVGNTPIKVQTTKRNITAFTAAVFGVQTNDDGAMAHLRPQVDNLINAALQSPDQNAYIGKLVRVDTADTVTDGGKGFPFVVHNWSPFNQG